MGPKSRSLVPLPASAAIREPSEHEALVQLISAAGAAFDSDLNRARDYLSRAAALLRTPAPLGRERIQGESVAPSKTPYRGGLAAWQAKRIIAHIDAHLCSKICAAQLARLVRLSTSHFFRAFRETFGEAPMLFVAKRRMEHAQRLMLNSRQTLSEIALACGLCDQAHFTRVFRRIVGQTPRYWRRQFAHDPTISANSASSAASVSSNGAVSSSSARQWH